MKVFLYSFIKFVVKTALYAGHKRIKVFGLEHIPTDKPVLFLPNHQSALIDVLLIVTKCRRKPYFLTRADVFSSPVLNRIFHFFRMLPIYRMRDGRETLANNKMVFDQCASLFAKKEALVLFPEANHNLKRRVRPLSKGFTRIILRTLELHPGLDLQIVPVGLNFKNAVHFPDEVAVYYGLPIALEGIYDPTDLSSSTLRLKEIVTSKLKQLTTHVPEDVEYDLVIKNLDADHVDYLNPVETNKKLVHAKDLNEVEGENTKSKKEKSSIARYIFIVLNLPLLLVWRLVIRPKIPEPEFIGTFRFAVVFVLFPFYCLLLVTVLSLLPGIMTALCVTALLIIVNVMLVKYVLR